MDLRKMMAGVGVGLMVVAGPMQAQGLDRLAIHGNVSQAFGVSDTGQVFGIPEAGTANYGTAALQFRYSLTANDNVTVQLSNRRLGRMAIGDVESTIHLDWAFYGRRFGEFEVKVGRIAIPAGIYNEIRDVGVLLPFYRVPLDFYLEGTYTSETVDGVVAGYLFGADSPWSVSVSGFAGGWDMLEPAGGAYNLSRARDGLGGELWVNTPFEGVRAGVGGSRYHAEVGNTPGTWKEWHASFDASLSRFTVQSEYRKITLPSGRYQAYYGYLGVHVIPTLTLNGMAEFADLSLDMGPMGVLDMDVNDEYTVGVNYAMSPNLVLKAEAHHTKGYQAEVPVMNPMGPPMTINFLLLSVAASF